MADRAKATYECRVESSKATTGIIRHLDATGEVTLDHFTELDGWLNIVLTTAEIKTLEQHGVKVERRAMLRLRDARDDVGTVGGIDLATGFVTGYLDATEVAARTAALASAHPTWCTLLTLPFATAGYDGSLATAVGPATVQALRITSNPTERSRPGFLLIAGTHAREWMNPLIALEFAEQLLKNVDPTSTEPAVVDITRIVTEGDIIVVPVLNPDGLNYSIHDDAGWRKNRRANPGAPSCPGVDNNRNFEIYFGGAGSSSYPCNGTYRGVSAFSEAETANIKWLMQEFPNILVAVDSHSFGQKVFRPHASGGTFISALPVSATDEEIYASLEAIFTTAVASVNGAVYLTGTTSNHAGTSDDYLFFAHRVFGFDTECGLSFQPSWSQAVPIIEEVVTGLRALAVATLNLNMTTPTSLSVVQCIDRTGSMVTFGYDSSARSNAKRFIDLMSLGDSAGIVTFADPSPDPNSTLVADRALVEFPLTLLDDPGDVVAARASIDAIDFGGWTPIGAGLERSSSMLAGSSSPRAVLLLSDGYENREPTVLATLAGWPSDIRVFTIALGPAADTGLLGSIATQTGGIFQVSPTALDLHVVYNQMRADMSDAETIINRAVNGTDAEEETDHAIDVEIGVNRLEVTVSSDEWRLGQVCLAAPSGREVSPDDFGVSTVYSDGYVIIGVDRPDPGQWNLTVTSMPSSYVVAAFARSALRTKIHLNSEVPTSGKFGLRATALFDGRELAPVRFRVRSKVLAGVSKVEHRTRFRMDGWTDLRAHKITPLINTKALAGAWLKWRGGQTTLPRGFSRVNVEIEGALPGGVRFRRVVTRTVRS